MRVTATEDGGSELSGSFFFRDGFEAIVVGLGAFQGAFEEGHRASARPTDFEVSQADDERLVSDSFTLGNTE